MDKFDSCYLHSPYLAQKNYLDIETDCWLHNKQLGWQLRGKSMKWQDYDNEGLRLQYRTDLTPGVKEHVSRYQQLSEEMLDRVPGHLDLPYGSAGPRQTLDIFPPDTGNAPILIFIHGGYWYFNSKDPRRFPAELFNSIGIAWAPINYRLAPAASMDEIVEDVRNAVAWLYEHASEYGCNSEQIYVSGNSAGGHLTTELISDNWPERFGLPKNVIKGVCAVSGLFDLEPLLECEPNDKLNMELDVAKRNSPIYHLSNEPAPVIVTCGANESDEFKRQSSEYAQTCRKADFPVSHFEMEEHDHFSIIGEFANAESQLFKELVSMIRD
jgi:arylformamidase